MVLPGYDNKSRSRGDEGQGDQAPHPGRACGFFPAGGTQGESHVAGAGEPLFRLKGTGLQDDFIQRQPLRAGAGFPGIVRQFRKLQAVLPGA